MGASALARHAYIAGIGSHASREDVVYTASGNMPEDISEMEFWAAADIYDSGNLYREIDLALPRELNWQQRIDLAEKFAATVAMGSPYSLAIHSPEGSDGKEQPHLHLIFSERTNDSVQRDNAADFFRRANRHDPAAGGAKKNREFKEFNFLKKVRALGSQMQNEALKDAGYSVRVTHKSYESMGWQMPAGVHLGQYHTQKMKEGKPTARVLRQREIEKAQAQYREFLKIDRERRQLAEKLGTPKKPPRKSSVYAPRERTAEQIAWNAINSNDHETLKQLLSCGAVTGDIKETYDDGYHWYETHAITTAIEMNHAEITKLLLEHGASIEIAEKLLSTAKQEAAEVIKAHLTQKAEQQAYGAAEKLDAIQRQQREFAELFDSEDLPIEVVAIMSATLAKEEEKLKESTNMIDVNTIIEIAQKAKRASNDKAETERKPTTEQQEQRKSKHTREDELTR